MRLVMLVLVLAIPLRVCSAFAEVTVTNAWVRGTTATQTATGAFMSVVSSDDATLVAAASSIAGNAEIHEMSTANGMMRMRRVERIDLPAHTTVNFAPSGYHIMLMDLKRQLVEGEPFPLTLIVVGKDGRRVDVPVTAVVAAITANSPPHRH